MKSVWNTCKCYRIIVGLSTFLNFIEQVLGVVLWLIKWLWVREGQGRISKCKWYWTAWLPSNTARKWKWLKYWTLLRCILACYVDWNSFISQSGTCNSHLSFHFQVGLAPPKVSLFTFTWPLSLPGWTLPNSLNLLQTIGWVPDIKTG